MNQVLIITRLIGKRYRYVAKRNNGILQKKKIDKKFELRAERGTDRKVKELIENASNPDNLAGKN